jgi:DNA-binding response OmpR family regulator
MGEPGERTVLVVGEFGPLCELLPQWLSQGDLKALPMSSATDALALFLECALRIDMVVVDAITPSAAVLDFTAELERLRPGFPVLYVVGPKPTILRCSIEAQAPDCVIVTPFREEDLRARVNGLLCGGAGRMFSAA